MMTDPSAINDRLKKIRDLIENAQPAETYFAEHSSVANEESPNIYQKHLDALIAEHDALLNDDYMNQREASSIRALLSYVSYNHEIREDVACAIVEEQFGLEEIRKLPRQKYMDVVEYLVDFDPRKIVN
ncbi:MAG: hypothetical protein PHD48_06635 [Alphaproteobacteria bacterium]|nr:hypothetical protein [Alphaproteobacteria bacterium]